MRPVFVRLSLTPVSRSRIIGTFVVSSALSSMCVVWLLEPQSVHDGKRSASPFATISVKSCGGVVPAGTGRGGGPGALEIVPGSANWHCATLAELIDQAYTSPQTPTLNRVLAAATRDDAFKRVRGGPPWVDDARFAIDVSLSGDTGVVSGHATRAELARVRDAIKPALQAMLEDLFRLKVHRAIELLPLYTLTVGKSGLDRQRVIPAAPGDCYDADAGPDAKPPAGVAGRPPCGSSHISRHDGHWKREFTGVTMTKLAQELSSLLNRIALDRTDLEDKYNFTIEYTPDAQTVFEALEALGLKLEAAEEAAEYFQIDSVQPPSLNDPLGDSIPGRALGAGKPGRE